MHLECITASRTRMRVTASRAHRPCCDRYIHGVDPAVTDAAMARRADKARAKESYRPWVPFTLF